MWRRTREEHVTVTVDEFVVNDVLKQIDAARLGALSEIGHATRKLESAVAEAKAERGRLEAAVATARRRGQGRW
jgi:hypothetical protein